MYLYRMQIHVDKDGKLTIFSKSGRDSTLDRIKTHEIILHHALNLSNENENCVQDVVLEAELYYLILIFFKC